MPDSPLPLVPCCSPDAPCAATQDLQRRLTTAETALTLVRGDRDRQFARAEEAEQRSSDLEACLAKAQDGYALGIRASQRALAKLLDSPVLIAGRVSPTLLQHTLEQLLPRTAQSSPLPKPDRTS